MQKISKRIGAVLMALSLLCGMLLSGIVLPASAEEAEATAKPFSFTVKDIIPFSGGKYVIGGKATNAWYDFTSSTVTESVAVRNVLNANFDLYYNNKDYYAAIPFGSTHSGDPNGSSASFKTLYQNSYLQRGGISSAYVPTSGFEVITAMVPKADGTQLAYKNFETTFDFDHNNSGAAAIFGFRQQTPGKFVDADGVLNKEQGFVLISKTGVTFGAGKGIADTMYTTETAKFATAAENKLRVTVKAVNDKLTVKVVGATSGKVYYDNSDAPATIDGDLAGTFAYGITAKKADFGAISLTYLDANGVAKDFDTLFNVNKFRADFSDVIAIADNAGKFASVNAFAPTAEDTAIQEWFNGKFGAYYNREAVEYCALDYIGQGSNTFQTDTGNPTNVIWNLEKSTQSLRFTRSGSGYAGTVLRKGFTLALKTSDGSLAKMKNFEAEVDFIVPGSSGRGGVFLSFREKDPGRMQASSGGVFNKEHCGDAVIVSDREVDGVVPGNLQDRTNANNAIAYADGKKLVADSPHTLYVKVVGNKLTWKVIKIDTKDVIGEGVETLTRDLPAGYISVGCTSQTRKLLDIRVTALGDSGEPVDFDNCATFEFTQKDTLEFANGKYTVSGQAWCDFNNTKDYAVALKNKYQSAFDGYYNNKDHYAETPVGTTYAGDPDQNFTAGVKTAQYNLWVQRGWKTKVADENMGVISSLVPKLDGTPLQYKNFEATTYFRMESANTTALIGFRQQTPGKFVDALNVVNKEQGLIVISATGIAIGAGDDIDNAMYNANTTATFGTAISGDRYIGVTVRVVNNKLTVKVFSSNSSTAYGSTIYYDNSATPVTIDYDKAGTIAFGIGRDNGLFGPVSVVHLDAAGAPVSYKVNDENAPEHVCDFATPKYDENGHWNECECSEKDEVVAHTMEGDFDENGHWTECACGAATEAVAHEFDNDCDTDCACGYTRTIEHNYATTEYDENGHWTVCACGAATEAVAHEFDNDCDTDCACGYTRTITHNFATAKYDETNHWNECACGEKADVTAHTMNTKFDENGHWTACDCGYATASEAHTMNGDFDDHDHWTECDCGYATEKAPHALTYVVDGDQHYQVCDCGYETEKAPHDFTEGDCACGEQKPNTAVADEEADVIIVKTEEGYQLKAGTLVVTDANGKRFVPERVGYREGGDASEYAIPEGYVGPFTVEAEFYQPTLDNLNMGLVGLSYNVERSGLRHVHRVNVIEEDGKLYMLADGAKVEVAEYGMLVASGSLLKDPEDLDVETADQSKHVHKFTWSADSDTKFYDLCDDYADISVHVVNIKTDKYDGSNTPIHSRTYVKLADGTIIHGAVESYTYNEVAGVQ